MVGRRTLLFISRAQPGVRSGFTLLELLVVLAIIIAVIAFTAPAVSSLSKSNNLNSAGRVVSNLLTAARSEAINRRALVRFEIATSWPADPTAAFRKYTLVQHDVAAGTDTQLTGWETLPSGTIFQPQDPQGANPTSGSGKYFFVVGQTQNPTLTVGGSNVPTSYIEFTPTGSLNMNLADSPVRLRIDQGVYNASSATVALTGTNNWYEASIDALIGRIRLSRP